MLCLPIELQRLCLQALEFGNTCPDYDIDYFEDDNEGPICCDTLKSLRLVSTELGGLATEQLFHTAVLNHTDESAQKLDNLLSSPHRDLVRRIIVNTGDDPENHRYQDVAKVQKRFVKAILRIKDFQKLHEIDLRFARQCALSSEAGRKMGWRHYEQDVAETVDFRNKILEAFFNTLLQAKSVHTISIKNLQDFHDPTIFQSENFLAARQRVQKLHLQIATEDYDPSPEENIEMPALHHFYSIDLAGIWLRPLSEQLTHLTLYGAECLWGVCPVVDFRKLLIFANLKSLSLGNMSIAHGWQLDWIVAHGMTLEELLMDDCFITVALRLYDWQANGSLPPQRQGTSRGGGLSNTHFTRVDIRWHTVFRRFQSELPRLRHFAIGSGDWRSGRAFGDRYELSNRLLKGRYGMFDCSSWVKMGSKRHENGYMYMERYGEQRLEPAPDCDLDDLCALEGLMQAVKSREEFDV